MPEEDIKTRFVRSATKYIMHSVEKKIQEIYPEIMQVMDENLVYRKGEPIGNAVDLRIGQNEKT